MNPGNLDRLHVEPVQNAAMLAMLRDARSMVYRDAESFDQAATVLEYVGQILACAVRNGLGRYETEILRLAGRAPCTNAHHVQELFHTVRRARNDSVHSGDYIRHHALRLVELLLILEETLSMNGQVAADLMVRTPVIAELWHNIASIRRAMLSNSFSYLPVRADRTSWKLVSDTAVVRYLNGFNSRERNERLGHQLGQAVAGGLQLLDCRCVRQDQPIASILEQIGYQPVLITEQINDEDRLLGIMTAFDLM